MTDVPPELGVTPTAAPPIVIGPFANVPAPGSPIRSDWPQQISSYVNTNVPNRVRAVTNAGTGERVVIQARDAVVSTNAGGDGTVTFVETFPTTPTVVAMMSSGGTPGPSQYIALTAVTTTQFTFRAFVNGTTAYQGAIRLTYVAVAYTT